MALQNIKKITSYLFLLRLLRMSLSMVTLIFSAKYFGVSIERDVWVLVTTFLATFGSAVWGPINETFRTKFIFLRENEGTNCAVTKTVSLIAFIVIITLIISVLILFFKNSIVAWLFMGSGESVKLFTTLLAIMMPSMLINQVTFIGISILNAFDIYYIPEVIGALSSFLNLLIIVALASQIGIFALAISQYIAISLLFCTVLYYLNRLNLFHWKNFFRINHKDFNIFLMFSLPFFVPYFVGQCNAFAEKWLAGLLGEGYVSSLDYARQFTIVLQGVISSVLTTVMVPLLAKAYAQKNIKQYSDILKENVTVCFAILAFAIPILCGAAIPLCQFFFLRGTVSIDSLKIIITLMRMYSIAFIGVILYMIIGYALLASNKGKQYAFWGVAVQLFALMLNFILIHVSGIYVFPFSLGIAHFLGAVVMSTLLLTNQRKWIYIRVLRYSLVLLGMSALIYLFNICFNTENKFGQLLLNVPVLIILFIMSSRWLDLNVQYYISRVLAKIKR